jgi:hypothetical protein
MRKLNANNLKYILGFLAVCLMIFYFAFYKEYSHSKKALKSSELSEINSYLKAYPNGKYSKEVLIHLEDIAFKGVLKDSSLVSVDNYISFCPKGRRMEDVLVVQFTKSTKVERVRNFINSYPNSKYILKAKLKLSQLWDEEIKFFNDNVKSLQINPNSKSVSFFKSLLSHMKDKNKGVFYIKFRHKKELKEFDEYPIETINLISTLYGGSDDGFISPKPSSSNVVALKDNFSEGNIIDLEKKVGEKLKENMESVFSKDFFEFKIITSNENIQVTNSDVMIEIEYKIQNKEIYGGPSLLTHSRSSDKYGSSRFFVDYVMDIKTIFNLKIKNPSVTSTSANSEYSLFENGQTQSEYRNIQSTSDGYIRMVTDTFDDFILKVSKNLGLKNDSNDNGLPPSQ